MCCLALPEKPIIEMEARQGVSRAFFAGQNVTFHCSANVGKPAGKLIWSRRYAHDRDFHQVMDDYVSTSHTRHQNGTTSMESVYTVQLTTSDDDAVYRCSINKHRIVMMIDDSLVSTSKSLSVECKINA